MKCDDLNEFILNYIVKDKTGMAVLLTGPWGYGKSYYIQNNLKSYLLDNGYQCVVVSLYGLKSTQEIGKQIYLNLRSIKLLNHEKDKSEGVSTGIAVGKIVGKTLLNSLFVMAGLNFPNMDEKVLQEVYESIDLTNKLIVLEDLERSEIKTVDLLGYVNNLTEQDHVKVLLVANEDELINKTENDGTILYSEDSQIYLRYKEKTVSDTIRLDDHQIEAFENIISEYGLIKYFSPKEVFGKVGLVNLRTLKYACQKTYELIGYLNKTDLTDYTYYEQFVDSVFFGVLKLSMALSANFDQASVWNGGEYYRGERDDNSVSFSNPTRQIHLLFRFCFDYILLHEAPSSKIIQDTFTAYTNYCLYESNQTADDTDLQILKSYYIQPEAAVIDAVSNVARRLAYGDDIPYKEYGDIARILIRIKYELDIDIQECKIHLVENLKGKKGLVDTDMMFIFDVGEPGSAENSEYLDLKGAMISQLNEMVDDGIPFGFDYDPKHIRELEKNVLHRDTSENFISRFDLVKLKNMILASNASELDDLRGVFFSAYRRGLSGNRSVYYSISKEDISTMNEIADFITEYKFDAFDKVQKLQLRMLKDNLAEMIDSSLKREVYT